MPPMAETATKLTQALWAELLPRIKYVLTDCDGVIWHSSQSIPGANTALQKFRQMGIKLGFVTNNSTVTQKRLMEKFKAQNVEARPEEIFCVNNLAIKYLKSKGITGKVYMIGHKSLHEELRAAGFSCNEDGPDPVGDFYQSWYNLELEDNVQAVIVGFENHFSLTKVCKAATYLERPECLFVATDADARIANPVNPNIVLPCTGSIIAAIQTPSGRAPEVIGKPSMLMTDMIRTVYPDLTGDNTLFIGDNLDTDIEFGRRNGFVTLLVLTGVHQTHHITSLNAPNFYTSSIADLVEFSE